MARRIEVDDEQFPTFTVGQRVRVPRKMIELVLRSRTGTVVAEQADLPGMYIVRLDRPATFYRLGVGNDGPCEELAEIRVANDELQPL